MRFAGLPEPTAKKPQRMTVAHIGHISRRNGSLCGPNPSQQPKDRNEFHAHIGPIHGCHDFAVSFLPLGCCFFGLLALLLRSPHRQSTALTVKATRGADLAS
jgi:hypothetical protein